MSSNQINCVEKYAWVDEALENAWNQPHFEEDEELNRETFGPAEESVAYIPIPMEIDDSDDDSISTVSLGDETVYDYEYDDFSVADAAEQEDDYEYPAAAAGDANGYAAPVDIALQLGAAPVWVRQTTHWVLDDGTVVYNGHADGQRVHDDDDDEELPLLVVYEAADAMDVV
jgi:hypothetical protein